MILQDIPDKGIIKYKEEDSYFFAEIIRKLDTCVVVEDFHIIFNASDHKLEKNIHVAIHEVKEIFADTAPEDFKQKYPEYFL